MNSRGEFLSAADGEQVLKLAAKEEFEYAEVDELGTVVEKDYTPYHIDQVLALKLVNRDAIAQANPVQTWESWSIRMSIGWL